MRSIDACARNALLVAPKTFPLANSHVPARICIRPPPKIAIPTITFGVCIPRVLKLYIDIKNVEEANINMPLICPVR